MTTKTAGKAIQIFGAVLFIALLAAVIWSLFQPAVKEGPMPEPWKKAHPAAAAT